MFAATAGYVIPFDQIPRIWLPSTQYCQAWPYMFKITLWCATSEALLLHVTDYVGNEYFRDEPLRGLAAFHVPESAMTPCP